MNKLIIEGAKLLKEVHVNSKGEDVAYYSVDVSYRHNGHRGVIGSDWIAALDGKLITETDCYIGYHDEYYLEDFPVEEIRHYQDISDVNSYYTDEDKRRIYQLFTERLLSVLEGHDYALAAIHRNSL